MSNLLMKIRKNVKKNDKGFTLIEMVVVIAIIAILAAVFINRYGAFTENARGQQVLAESKLIATAIDADYIETGSYPTTGVNTAYPLEVSATGGILTITAAGGFTYAKAVGASTYTATRLGTTATTDNTNTITVTHVATVTP